MQPGINIKDKMWTCGSPRFACSRIELNYIEPSLYKINNYSSQHDHRGKKHGSVICSIVLTK